MRGPRDGEEVTQGIAGGALDAQPLAIERLDRSTPVLVLTASPLARRSPHGAIGILRSLGRMGVPVYTADSDPRGPASYSRYIRGRFVFDLANASPEASVDYLLDIGRTWPARPILIPTWDEAAVMVSDHANALRERYLFPAQPDGLAWSLADKKTMAQLARRHDVPTPNATYPSSLDDVRDYAATATFPVMLKGILGNALARRTGRTMVIVEDPAELIRLYHEMEDPDRPNLMLQEYIPGGDDVVWMFNGYFDADSDCLFGVTGRKLRQTPIHTGATSLGVCEHNEVVDEMTRRWMKELGYRGILDIGYRYDARDGRYKVLDVNPRIGGTFRLFVASNGLDVARAMYLDLTGQPVPTSVPVEGRKWLDEVDVRSSLQYRRAGELTVRGWATSLVGLRETVYVARDDPAPFVRVCARELRSAADGVAGAIGTRLGASRARSRPDHTAMDRQAGRTTPGRQVGGTAPMHRSSFLARDFDVPEGTIHTRDYLARIGVPSLRPASSPFDPGYDPVTFEGHLLQSGRLMESMKISMAGWQICDEHVTRWKVAACKRYDVPSVTGGGPFEVAFQQGQLPLYLDLVADIGVDRIEAGEGFTDLPLAPPQVVSMARERGLQVQFELGKKHGGTFTDDVVVELIEQGHRWLEAGAAQIVIEARESAQSIGCFDESGRFRPEIAERFAVAFGLGVCMFEAPTKASQFALLDHFGPAVQLCNIRLEELLRVEIYRRGLHSDSFQRDNLRPVAPTTASDADD